MTSTRTAPHYVTLTHYEALRADGGRSRARLAADLYGLATASWVERVDTTYTLGQNVMVDAYGRDRGGQVTKVGRTTVTVRFRANVQGRMSTRSFRGTSVRPLSDDVTRCVRRTDVTAEVVRVGA